MPQTARERIDIAREDAVDDVQTGSGNRRRDEQIDAFMRKTAETIYHPVGSAKMGCNADSAVDPQLKVYGVEGLRVVDASIMPSLVSGNTNAPTIMIAEKASDMILGKAALPPLHLRVAEDDGKAGREAA